MKKMIASLLCVTAIGMMLCGCGTFDFSIGADDEKYEEISSEFKPDMTSFSAEDLDGNEVNQDVFKDYDVTMINVWDTTCQACVEEMPALEKLYEGLDKNVNIISVCTDGADEKETAQKILKESGVTFRTLQGNDEINPQFEVNGMSAHPTTFFVDSQGNMVGTVQVGQPDKAYDDDALMEGYSALIDQALEDVK